MSTPFSCPLRPPVSARPIVQPVRQGPPSSHMSRPVFSRHPHAATSAVFRIQPGTGVSMTLYGPTSPLGFRVSPVDHPFDAPREPASNISITLSSCKSIFQGILTHLENRFDRTSNRLVLVLLPNLHLCLYPTDQYPINSKRSQHWPPPTAVPRCKRCFVIISRKTGEPP